MAAARAVSLLCTLSAVAYAANDFDVIVYGATPGGIAAAVVAANGTGLRVALLEAGPRVGGMSGPGGIGLRDINNETVSGVADSRSVLNRWLHLNRLAYNASAAVWQPDAAVAESNWQALLADPRYGLVVSTQTGLMESSAAVTRSGLAITSITTVNTSSEDPSTARVWTARVFVDASYEGDLLVAGGAAHAVGREGRDDYNESLAGIRDPGNFSQFQFPVDPLAADGSALPGVDAAPPPPLGSGDGRVMPFSYRFCVINTVDRVPWPRPAGYDPARFELLVRYAESLTAKYGPAGPPLAALVAQYEYRGYPAGAGRPMRYDLCESGDSAVSTDEPTAAYGDYIAGNRSVRAAVAATVKGWVAGFLYTLARDPRVPEGTRNSTAAWGLCPDAWPEAGHMPPLIYVREAVRLRGDAVATQNNLQRGVCEPTSVGLGSWTIDAHIMRRYVGTLRGAASAVNEGEIGFARLPGPATASDVYELPYSLLLPRRADVSNLLVVSCPSASHVAFSAIRVEPTFMQLGTAAGVAAAIAVQSHVAVQDVPIAALQAGLAAAGQCFRTPDVGACADTSKC